jgi:phosphonate degradation associated HDIG domain protein
MRLTIMNIVDEVIELFGRKGSAMYGGEAVTQLEHALQAAYLAELANAPPQLVAAALMHDIGHLIHNLPENASDRGIDDKHEVLGQKWLARYFVPEVCEPVRLHVPAKRYLCSVESQYLAQLSPESFKSLNLQGGAMNDAEVGDFEKHPFYKQAVQLRRWDDEAKVVGMPTPAIEHYRDCLLHSLLAN